ncbi:hypothetical protein QWY92_07995 [Algibacter miyuki]|uniref:hypothetical protein n=1 Tax=Algibacter miyuki TaxID=1306933 RepID=UPI0025B3E9A8|nr:hypothetical protein [Algibacter miyuki]MDN3665351.1 hypothetical protein [Algibacter miyuki]
MSVLNNADAGDDEIIGSVNTNYTILNSGNMDQLSVSLDEANLNVINVGTGIYTLEASLLIRLQHQIQVEGSQSVEVFIIWGIIWIFMFRTLLKVAHQDIY